jgi:lipopolysaccharide export system permease protein
MLPVMKINSIINRYIFKEMISPFVISVVFFTFVFLMTKILDITNLIVNYRVDLSAVLWILIYSIPYFLEFVIPISIMLTVLLTFLRLSGDNEIVALKAGGMSIYELLPSVFFFCFLGCLLTGFMSIYGLPWGRLSIKELTLKVAASGIDMGLKEKTFNESFKGVMLYINKIDLKDKSLIDVFIEDKRSKNIVSTIIAPKGKLFSEPDKFVFHLRLYDGTINQVALERKAVHSVHFDTYDINLNLDKAVAVAKGKQKHKKEMSLAELHRFLKTTNRKDDRYYSILIEFHKKFSIPFACFAFGLLAVPLGMVSSPAKRSFGLGLGLIFVLLYYLLLSAGKVFGETGIYPPAIGMWVPNIVIGGIGVFVLVKTGKERPLRIDVLPGWVKRVISRFSVH